MNAHIINCDENDFKNLFLPNGYIGVGLVITGTTPQKLSSACRTSYSMYADMKTIRPGDIIFVHAGQKIYGAFSAATEFVEDPSTPVRFLSKNIHYYPNPAVPRSGWSGHIRSIPNLGYYRRIAIMPFIDNRGNNFCFETGIDSTEVFELKNKKKIWSIPERWKYTDTARTVRPLMEDEALELLKILERDNADNSNRLNISPANLASFTSIEFILNPAIIENEKIIEGWLLENIGRNRALDSAVGPLSSFGNNIPVGYLRFIDIFGYQQLTTGIKKFKVIEVKKSDCTFPDDINQLIGYTDWVTEHIAGGDVKTVEGIIVAMNFNNECVAFVNNFNTTGRKIRLIQFTYNQPAYNNLNIARVV